MNKLDILLMGIRNLWRRKLRTLLTVLGVVIGASAIVIMISLSIGIQVATRKQVEGYGDLNNIRVRANYGGEQGDIKLDEEMYEKIMEIEGIEAATPILNTSVTFMCGKYELSEWVVGLNTDALPVFGVELEQGRFLTEEDEMGIIFTKRSLMRFEKPKRSGSGGRISYGGYGYGYGYGRGGEQEDEEPPIDVMTNKVRLFAGRRDSSADSVRPKIYKAAAVGILSKDNNSELAEQTIMNIETVKKLKKEYDRQRDRDSKSEIEYDTIIIRAKDVDSAIKICEEIEALGLHTRSMSTHLKEMEESTKTIRMILGGIGAISMLVAALMIANTMVMSIYERTREIGIMKVLGAGLGDIGRLFLVESALIGLVGGVVGIGTSYGISKLMNTFMGSGLLGRELPEGAPISVIPFWLILLALGFTSIVGLASGLYPSVKAMRISALEAIKTE
ncbi:ABC transporter permease [Clostridium sp. 'deep sea']|uniref:ABC transporter permease n=1 Tax=Clostridium sp. 'deep sea' TaxID=2779445 RepID=UPI00189646D7|nr:ABC transporter permease [Clostridium sp. 'deep sea']QOR34400.1 ABC transporter permease [Clostridium sp. 'deep sea']